MISLKEITRENIDEILALKVNEDQRTFVSSNGDSLAQAYVYPKTAFPFAVYEDSTVVGFIMMGYYEVKEYYTLWKFMIDSRYQNRGYGRKALELGIGYLKNRFDVSEIYTGVVPGNVTAKKLYESVGFRETGLIELGMEEMRLELIKINYVLKKPAMIVPWGNESKYLHWFGLTDGELWIDAGDSVIYEYLEPHSDPFGKLVKYDDYQLSRFIEDLLNLTPFISESVPESLYNVIGNLAADFRTLKDKYIDLSDDEFDAFYDEFYLPLSEWFYNRFLDSSHLICGPSIGFFRCGDKLKIIWDSDTLEDGTEIWKYPRGIFETSYQCFVSEVSGFIKSFTNDMDDQVSDVARNGIPGVSVDVDALVRENAQRKETFAHQQRSLHSEEKLETDWNTILDLYKTMRGELGMD